MTLTVKLPKNAAKLQTINEQLAAYGLTSDDSVERIEAAWMVARSMIISGCNVIDRVAALPRGQRVDAFNSDPDLCKWFGAIARPKQAKTVRNRLRGILRRHGRNVTIAVRPDKFDSDGERTTPSATTAGAANLTHPRTRFYVRLIRKHIWEVAETAVHELGHHYFFDQKIDGETVYDEDLAVRLAEEYPRKARRSPENYALFCANRHTADGKRETTSRIFNVASSEHPLLNGVRNNISKQISI